MNTNELIARHVKYLDMLTSRRPDGSASEAGWVHKYILSAHPSAVFDGYHNVWITTDPNSTTLFSAHTDTMHRSPGDQRIDVHEIGALITSGEIDDCLGADNASGCYVLLQLIAANIPGTYVFHRAEERGGKGSRWIATNMAGTVQKFKRAIAFDRRGYRDVITHQAGGRCASQAFAEALSEELNRNHPKLEYRPDATGIFTDTANYKTLIPECTNISVGYFEEHTTREAQDLTFLDRLITAALAIDWEQLPTTRNPLEPEQHRSFFYNAPSRPRNVLPRSFLQTLLAEDPLGIIEFLTDMEVTATDLRPYVDEFDKLRKKHIEATRPRKPPRTQPRAPRK